MAVFANVKLKMPEPENPGFEKVSDNLIHIAQTEHDLDKGQIQLIDEAEAENLRLISNVKAPNYSAHSHRLALSELRLRSNAK